MDEDGIADYLQKQNISAQEIDEAINQYILAQADSGAYFNLGGLMKKFKSIKKKVSGIKDKISSVKNLVSA